MTQAISLSQIISRHDHKLCAVLIGQNQTREVPHFFLERVGAPVSRFNSPNFQLDAKRRGVSILGTTKWSLKRFPSFIKGLLTIRRAVRQFRPNIIVNFFDPLVGLYATLFRPRAKVVSVAHNYLLFHPQFVFGSINYLHRKQRMASEFKEIVIDTHLFPLENLCPYIG